MERKPGATGKSFHLPPGTLPKVEYRRNGESTAPGMLKIECGSESVEEGVRDLEKAEKELMLFRGGKKRRLAMEEVELKGEDFLKHESDEEMVLVHERAWNQGRARLREVEIQERELKSARDAVAESEKKVAFIIDTLDGRINAVEKREKEFNLLMQRKMRELSLKEEELSNKAGEFVDKVKMADEKLVEKLMKQVEKERDFVVLIEKGMEELELKEKQLNMKEEEFVREVKQADKKFRMREESLRHDCMKRMNMSESKIEAVKENVDKKVKEIEFVCNAGWKIPWDTIKEAESIRESVEKQFEELEKMKREFDSFQEKKMGELASKEQQLCMMNKELVDDARSRDKQLIEREKLGCQLVKRLESALDHVKDLKKLVEEKSKKIVLEETEVQSIREWVDRKMDELDSKAVELQEEDKTILKKKELLKSKEHELHLREKELKLREESLFSQQRDLELKQREFESASVDLDWREKNLKSVKEFVRSCFKEHVAIKKEALTKKDLVEKLARDLKHKEDQLESKEREMESKEKQLMAHLKEPKLKLLEWNYPLEANRNLESGDSVDIKFIVTMDGKTLQMFLNDPQKDLDLMRDEILTVLHLSSDPAKIVLDAMVGFYPPHLHEGDTDSNVQRTCIILLEQLVRMSPKINPHVREEAIELAHEWKSKMRGTAENPWELLGFLHLLAAYDLTSYFDENEVMSFLTKVAQYRQTPKLCGVLGFTDSFGVNSIPMKQGKNAS